MKPNVLFIITDDQTINTINSKGNNEIITPNLDQLCSEGMYFTNCHIQGGTSGALCMPSRAMINTSKNMLELEHAGNSIPADHPLLGETLLNNGYNTFFTGKWHNGVEGFNRSFNSGENIFFGGMWDHYNVPMNDFDPTGKYDNKVKYIVDFLHSNQPLEMIANKFNNGEYSIDVVTQSAERYIENYDSSKPFYMNVAYLAPHDPRIVDEKYIRMYDDKKITLPLNFLHDHPFNFGQEIERDEILAQRPLNEEWCKNEIKTYYGMITQIDEHVGRLIKKLKEKGIYDDTLIIFTSDNGLCLSAHGLMGKQNLYDESIRIPFIIKGKNIEANQECNALIQLQDIFPTLVDYLELNIDTELDGKSFKKCLLGESNKLRDEIYLIYTDLIRGIKTPNYKYLQYRYHQGEKKVQLFDLTKDVYETKDVANDPEYAKILQEMELLFNEKSIKVENDNVFSKQYWCK